MPPGPEPDRRLERNLVRAIAALAQLASLAALFLSFFMIGFTCFADTSTCEFSDASRSRFNLLALGLWIVAEAVLWLAGRRLAREQQGVVGWMLLVAAATLAIQLGAIYVPLMIISS
jgi:steroid 5-alpha reductase family enzyme